MKKYFIPFTRHEIVIDGSYSEIKNKVLSRVDLKEELTMSKSPRYFKDYEGAINEKSFQVRRLMEFGYSAFIPSLHAELINSKDKLKLFVCVKFPTIIYLFLLAFALVNMIPIYNDLPLLLDENYIKEMEELYKGTGLNYLIPQKKEMWMGLIKNVLFLSLPYLLVLYLYTKEIKCLKGDFEFLFNEPR